MSDTAVVLVIQRGVGRCCHRGVGKAVPGSAILAPIGEVIGECEIKQRNIKTNEMIVDKVSGRDPHPVDIRVGYTHQIQNIGKVDSHTIMWISEIYSPDTPDTFREEVEK